MSADLEPHTIKSDIGLGWVWNTDSGNGAGGANENLLRTTVSRLAYAHKRLSVSGLKLRGGDLVEVSGNSTMLEGSPTVM